jgi:hypothetical protein
VDQRDCNQNGAGGGPFHSCYMSGMDKKDPYKLDALDASLNPYGRHLRHLAEHAGTIPARLDEFGRCAYCVQRGWWKPDA